MAAPRRRWQARWRAVRSSRRARIAGTVVLAISLVVATAVVGQVRGHDLPAREPSPVAAGAKAAGYLLELPVPLHEAAREALRATQEARVALATGDGDRLSATRKRLQHARTAVTAFEDDQSVSPEQRRTIAELNRQLQRMIAAVDRAS